MRREGNREPPVPRPTAARFVGDRATIAGPGPNSGGMPHPALRPPSARAGQIAREIDRDEQIVRIALRRRLAALLRPGPAADLAATLEALAAALAHAAALARRLNDARITRRGERGQTAGPRAAM